MDGLVTNLATADGEPWQYNFADVDAISLSQAALRPNGTWSETAASDDTNAARITTAAVAGAGRGGSQTGMFQGELVGGSGADAGSEVVGTWSVGAQTVDGDAGYLAGGFGAVRGEDIPDTRPAVDDGTGVKGTSLAAAPDDDGTPATELEDGMLKVTFEKYAWSPRGDTELTAVTATSYDAVDDDDDTTDVMENQETVEISLAGLFDNQNAERTTNGETWVGVARTEIEGIRTKLAALIDTDQNPGEGTDGTGGAQPDLWEDFQWVVATKLFFAGDNVNVLDGTDIAAAYDKDEALGVIDDVLQALSSADALDDALDEDGGGVFTRNDNGDPIPLDGSDETVSGMFGQQQYQVKAWLGSTDYTRFGVWRVRRTRNATRQGDWQRGAVADQRGAFAYSPLAVAKIPGVNSPAYPSGSTATYEGSTIAWATRSDETNTGQGWGLEGSIALTVAWGTGVDAGNVGGAVTAVISDLVDPDGDPLVTNDGSRSVRQIHISGVEVDVAPNEELVISGTAAAAAHFTDFGATVSLGGASMSGEFVGLSSQQGPLAVIGRWGATGLSLQNPGNNLAEDGQEARLPVTLLGAFGAELP